MKDIRPKLTDLISGVPDTRKPGRLLAIPQGETQPGTSFEQLVRKLLPNKESFFYFQRMLLAAPPSFSGLAPHDHVLQGPFRLALLADRRADEAHPFRIGRKGDPPLALRPHDGCGYIKESIAIKMPLYQKIIEDQKRPLLMRRFRAFGESRLSHLPPQALQHYPRSQSVTEEAQLFLRNELEKDPIVQNQRLYRTILTGNITGKIGIAAPSANENMYLNWRKSACFNPKGKGILVGKSPYDKHNLRPIAVKRIVTAEQGDPTAQFLDTCTTLQYTYVGNDRETDHQPDGPDLFFAKGLLIVLPDELWPEEYRDQSMVLSNEDVKTHSRWGDRKRRSELPQTMDSSGSLMVCDVIPPGSLVAMPVVEQKKLEGDFDGDPLLLIGDRPALWEHVRQCDDIEIQKNRPLFKPPKTHTPAVNPSTGIYDFSRASQIMSTQYKLLEMYNTLQHTFLAQPDYVKNEMGQRAIFGIYEGCEPTLRANLRTLLIPSNVRQEEIEALLPAARKNHATARHPLGRQLSQGLLDLLEAWHRENGDPPVLDPLIAELSEELKGHYPRLATAYESAKNTNERLRAFVQFYPVARLSSEKFPDRPGYVDDPIQTIENLLTLGIKTSTDCYKTDAAAPIFNEIATYLDRCFFTANDRIKKVPYTRDVAKYVLDGNFDVPRNLDLLERNPNLAAGLMEMSIKELVEHGVLGEKKGKPLAPVDVDLDQPAQKLVELSRNVEKKITPMIQKVAELTKGKLENTANIVKTFHSVRDKLNLQMRARGKNLKEAVATIDDGLRYSLVYPRESFVEQYFSGARELEKLGFTRVRVSNSFIEENPAFAAVNTTWKSPDNFSFELQFHTPESVASKIRFHDLYKELQASEVQGATKAELQEMSTEAIRAIKLMPIPSRIKEIHNWNFEIQLTDDQYLALHRGKSQIVSHSPLFIREMCDLARVVQKEYTGVIQHLANEIGATLCSLTDKEQLKSKHSIHNSYKWLISYKGLNHDEAIRQIDDALRYELQLPRASFTAGYHKAIEYLTSPDVGLVVKKVKNYFTKTDTPYLGINVVFQPPGTQLLPFEIQFHTRASLELKRFGHTEYKRIQIAQTAGEEVLPQLLAKMDSARKIAAGADRPAGIESVRDLRA